MKGLVIPSTTVDLGLFNKISVTALESSAEVRVLHYHMGKDYSRVASVSDFPTQTPDLLGGQETLNTYSVS